MSAILSQMNEQLYCMDDIFSSYKKKFKAEVPNGASAKDAQKKAKMESKISILSWRFKKFIIDLQGRSIKSILDECLYYHPEDTLKLGSNNL